MNFKKLGLLVSMLMLVALLVAACGDSTTAAPAAATTTTAASSAATTAAATAAATTAAASASATTAAPATGGKKLKVGFVTDIGGVNDKSFNESAYNALKQAEKDLGATIKVIETKDTKDFEKNIKQFVDEKYDVVITVGFLIFDATEAAAKNYPTVKFIGVDQSHAKANLPNLAGLIFEEDKSGFLAGALAAGMSKTGKIAAVLGTKAVPAVQKFGEGYKAGAEYLAKNNASLLQAKYSDTNLTYHPDGNNAFSDPDFGAKQAESLIGTGYDVIFGAGGQTGNGAVEAGADKGKYVIGVDTDQYLTLPKAKAKILSSATKDITAGVFNLIKGATADQFKGGDTVGTVSLAPFHDTDKEIPQALKDALTAIDKGLKDGSIKTGVEIK